MKTPPVRLVLLAACATIEARVARSIDLAHSARSERRQNLVRAKLETGLEMRHIRGQRKDGGRSRRETGRLLEKTAGAVVRGQQRLDFPAHRLVVADCDKKARAILARTREGVGKQLLQSPPVVGLHGCRAGAPDLIAGTVNHRMCARFERAETLFEQEPGTLEAVFVRVGRDLERLAHCDGDRGERLRDLREILTSSKTGNLNLTEAWKDNVVLDYAGLSVAEMTDAPAIGSTVRSS